MNQHSGVFHALFHRRGESNRFALACCLGSGSGQKIFFSVMVAFALACLPIPASTETPVSRTVHHSFATGPQERAHNSHEALFGSDVPCQGCALQVLAMALAQADEQPTGDKRAETLRDAVRRVGELVMNGKKESARDLVAAAILQCESGERDVRECSQWLRAMQGLSLILRDSPQPVIIENSLGMKLVRIPAGEYMMGSLEREMDWLRLTFRKIWREGHKQWFQDELPLHPVRISKPFYIGATEVTVDQFRQFVRDAKYKTDAEKNDGGMIFSRDENRWVPDKKMKWDSPPWRAEDKQPVVFVSWNDATEFCRWLSRKEKRTYRLPTEAEWEMACRGGAAWVRYPWGNRLPGGSDTNFGDQNSKLPGGLSLVDDGHTNVAPVGSYPPNGYGLFDMAGNVMEWVRDRYDRNYYQNSPLEDPKGPDVGVARVNKGGNFYASPADGRCAFRGFSSPEMNFFNLGFRVVMEAPEEELITASKKEDPKGSASSESSSPGFPPPDSEALGLFQRAMFEAQQQQWDEAIEDLEKALRIYEKREDRKWIARVKATLAGIYGERNRKYKAKEMFTQALAGFRSIGDTASANMILQALQDLDTSPGVKVVEVKKGGAADKVGIVAGDVVIEYAGETGFRVQGFKRLVEDYSRTSQLTVTVLNNDQMTTSVVPGGPLGIAVEDIKRPPRRRPSRNERANRDRQRDRSNRDRRSRRR